MTNEQLKDLLARAIADVTEGAGADSSIYEFQSQAVIEALTPMMTAVDSNALQIAVDVGVEQFQQQMTLGGGNLNQMFEKVISAYLKAAAPMLAASDSKQSGYDTREDSCKGAALASLPDCWKGE
jgi:hypothetical protein